MISKDMNVEIVNDLKENIDGIAISSLFEAGYHDLAKNASTFAADVETMYCKTCGTLRYSLWKLKIKSFSSSGWPRLDRPKNFEDKYFKELDKCPICKSTETSFPLDGVNYNYSACKNQQDVNCQIKKVCKHVLISTRSEDRKKSSKKVQNVIKAFDKSSNIIVPSSVFSIKQSPEKLMQYILHLIHLETSIYAITQRLDDLYYEENQIHRTVVYESNQPNPLEEKKNKIEKELLLAKKEVSSTENDLHKAEEALSHAKKVLFEVGTHPLQIDNPQKPVEPQYEKPSLFNKKKILAENAEKKKRYERELSEYQRKLFECERLRKEFSPENKKKEVMQAEEKLVNAKSRLSTATKKLKSNQDSLEKICAEMEKQKNERGLGLSPSRVLDNSFLQEIAEAEELLQKSFSARNELYDYNIVFGKYRDIVALTTFYEYLMSGRCSSLEGADGAYNLYESEIRANMIISQLSTIITQLDQIQQNQYMLFSELKKVNQNLSNLNKSMYEIKKSIDKVGENTALIATSAEMIAYNSEVTAYYSKKNAELADALGYMTALK